MCNRWSCCPVYMFNWTSMFIFYHTTRAPKAIYVLLNKPYPKMIYSFFLLPIAFQTAICSTSKISTILRVVCVAYRTKKRKDRYQKLAIMISCKLKSRCHLHEAMPWWESAVLVKDANVKEQLASTSVEEFCYGRLQKIHREVTVQCWNQNKKDSPVHVALEISQYSESQLTNWSVFSSVKNHNLNIFRGKKAIRCNLPDMCYQQREDN